MVAYSCLFTCTWSRCCPVTSCRDALEIYRKETLRCTCRSSQDSVDQTTCSKVYGEGAVGQKVYRLPCHIDTQCAILDQLYNGARSPTLGHLETSSAPHSSPTHRMCDTIKA